MRSRSDSDGLEFHPPARPDRGPGSPNRTGAGWPVATGSKKTPVSGRSLRRRKLHGPFREEAAALHRPRRRQWRERLVDSAQRKSPSVLERLFAYSAAHARRRPRPTLERSRRSGVIASRSEASVTGDSDGRTLRLALLADWLSGVAADEARRVGGHLETARWRPPASRWQPPR